MNNGVDPMQEKFVMFSYEDNDLEIRVISNQAGRDYLIRWCKEQFSCCERGGSHSYSNSRMLTPFRFECLEDAMAFKLRWA